MQWDVVSASAVGSAAGMLSWHQPGGLPVWTLITQVYSFTSHTTLVEVAGQP